jgi:hypothetical protein
MKNEDIERYNLSEEHKAELRYLRNLRKRDRLTREGRARMLELMKNGRRK